MVIIPLIELELMNVFRVLLGLVVLTLHPILLLVPWEVSQKSWH